MSATIQKVLPTSSSFGDVKVFLQECENIGKEAGAIRGYGKFIQSLRVIFQSVCEETELKPVWLECENSTSETKWQQTRVIACFLSCRGGIITLGVFTRLKKFGISFSLYAIPGSMLPDLSGEKHESAIRHLVAPWVSYWSPNISLPYQEVPLKYAENLCIAPWIEAESMGFMRDPRRTAARVVQYARLAEGYDSIPNHFAGTGVPSYLLEELEKSRCQYLIVGYTDNARAQTVYVGKTFALEWAAYPLYLHPVRRQGDKCVIWESTFACVDLDKDGDSCRAGPWAYLIEGDETQYPLRDIAEGNIPPEVIEAIYTLRPRRKRRGSVQQEQQQERKTP